MLIIQNTTPDIEKMILGNKCDLEEERVVSTKKGRMVSFHMCRVGVGLYNNSNIHTLTVTLV